MRPIEFRGLRTDGKGWAYGDLLQPHQGNPDTFIAVNNGHIHPVNQSTVGQFTGFYDRNGVKIWEGDLVEISTLTKVVRYSDEYATFTLNRLETDHIQVYNINYKVITVTGNIHEPATGRE